MKRRIVFHPLLFALFPVVSLASHNIGLILPSETFLPIVIVLVFTVVLWSCSKWAIKNSDKTGIVASGFLLLFFSFGHLFYVARKLQLGGFVLVGYVFLLLAMWAMVFALPIRTRTSLQRVTYILNISSLFLVAIPLISIGQYKLTAVVPEQDNVTRENVQARIGHSKSIDKVPSIYYIILDTYADAETLKRYYSFDNTDFLSYLSGKGFYVARKSRSNYLKTAHSLASSLNMEHIDYLSAKVGADSNDWSPLYAMLQDYKVWRMLKVRGYNFIHFGSSWEPTRKNRHADVNFNLDPLPQFFYVLYRSTLLYPFGSELGFLDFRFANWKRVHYQLAKLAEMPKIKEPKFVFAHFLITHEPYAFDPDGRFLTRGEYTRRGRRENYVNQVIFANGRIRTLIDKLIAASEVPPIIVLQSDEGAWPERFGAYQLNINWTRASKEELREKMGILNAYYLPGVKQKVLYDSITPVNSFRVIFDLYFNATLPLLSDKSYAFVDERHPYKFFDITDKIRD